MLPPKKYRDLTAEQIRQCYERCFGTDDGDIVIADLWSFCFGNNPSYVPGDSLATAFNEGHRNVLLRILSFTGQIQFEDMEVLCRTLKFRTQDNPKLKRLLRRILAAVGLSKGQ